AEPAQLRRPGGRHGGQHRGRAGLQEADRPVRAAEPGQGRAQLLPGAGRGRSGPLITEPGTAERAASAPAGSPAAQPLIDVRRVNKRYANGTLALEDISLQVRPGEFVTLVGPSGCGKSTVLRIVAGLGAVTGGRVSVDGQP